VEGKLLIHAVRQKLTVSYGLL